MGYQAIYAMWGYVSPTGMQAYEVEICPVVLLGGVEGTTKKPCLVSFLQGEMLPATLQSMNAPDGPFATSMYPTRLELSRLLLFERSTSTSAGNPQVWRSPAGGG